MIIFVKKSRMRNLIVLLSVFTVLLFSSCSDREEKNSIEVMTFNIRYDNPADSLNSWSMRAPLVYRFIEDKKPDLLGLQEALWKQYEYLDTLLTDYASAGVGRDDGARGGEMNPVFYRKDRFDLIRNKTFWLSENPDSAGSISWGSSLPRIVTWMELSDKLTGEHFYIFNTHFAHDSDTARMMSSQLLMSEIDSIANGFPFVVTGDFNMKISDEGYRILTGPFESVPLMADAYAISEKKHTGPAYTFNGFSDTTRGGRIDYIFVRKGLRVLSHRAYIKKEHGTFLSDHWPVSASVLIKKELP
jgi:endonuclease/exonuclease/phosphatase family metal-dependent hydrolase